MCRSTHLLLAALACTALRVAADPGRSIIPQLQARSSTQSRRAFRMPLHHARVHLPESWPGHSMTSWSTSRLRAQDRTAACLAVRAGRPRVSRRGRIRAGTKHARTRAGLNAEPAQEYEHEVSKVWIGLYAVVALSGCATGLVSSWKAPDAEPFRMRGEKVAAVVMANDQAIRLAGEEALARELSARSRRRADVHAARRCRSGRSEGTAAERAGVVGVVVLRPVRVDKEILSTLISSDPVYGGFWGGYYGHGWGSAWSAAEIRTDTIIIVETLVYSLHQNKLVWSGQSKTTNPANLNRLIENTAKQVGDELVRQGLLTK